VGDTVSRMLEQVGERRRPPLEQWDPPLSGDLDMRIAADGTWFYQGGRIERDTLVRLFASILRFEPGVGHVLVTPVEKWRIEVEDAPLLATAVDIDTDEVRLATNMGHDITLGPDHPLEIRPGADGPLPRVLVERGLWARLSRPVYYELANHAEEVDGVAGITSHGRFFPLQ
jgi:uncharacterized protein